MRLPRSTTSLTTVSVFLFASPLIGATITYTTLDYPGSTHSVLEGIYGSQVAGSYSVGSGIAHGFLYDLITHSFTTFDDPQAVGDTSVQNLYGNQLAGYYPTSDGKKHGFLYDTVNHSWTTLDAPGMVETVATGVSPGYVTGGSFDSFGNSHAYVYDQGSHTWTSLNYPSSGYTGGQGNDGANMVGSYIDSFGIWHGFLYDLTTHAWSTLDNPAADASVIGSNVANYVTAAYVVGQFVDSSGHQYGYLYDRTAHSFTTLDVPGSLRTDGTAIFGNTLVGTYADNAGQVHGYITTVPEPMTIAMLGLGIAFLFPLGWRRDRNRARHRDSMGMVE